MGSTGVILAKEGLLETKTIQEDQISRNGGIWPECAHTLFLCMDSFQEGLAAGRISSFCFKEPVVFHSLDQLLFAVEEIVDRAALIRADSRLRSLIQAEDGKGSQSRNHEEWAYKPTHFEQQWAYRTENVAVCKGRLCSFYLRIYTRRHASMQGILAQAGKKGEPVAFRSGLELLHMLHEVLTETTRR